MTAEHRSQRDDGLARADLTLQQPVHRPAPGQLGGEQLADRALTVGQRERQPRVERGEQTSRPRGALLGDQRVAGPPPLGEDDLQDERLVVAQPAHPRPHVRVEGRLVHQPQRLGPAQQRAPVPQRLAAAAHGSARSVRGRPPCAARSETRSGRSVAEYTGIKWVSRLVTCPSTAPGSMTSKSGWVSCQRSW